MERNKLKNILSIPINPIVGIDHRGQGRQTIELNKVYQLKYDCKHFKVASLHHNLVSKHDLSLLN
jgi:hypothetical protein